MERAGAGRLADVALRRPRLVLLVWLAATAVLAVNGTQLERHIAPTSIEVPGTLSQDAQEIADREIGSRGQAPILLEGPAAAVRTQAAALTRALRADPRATVISAFDPGAPPELRTRGGGAVVLVERPTDESFGPEVSEAVQEAVDAQVRPPVRASVSGFSAIGSAISEESVSNAHQAEKLALPILLLILLCVFRTPLAAAVPAVLGGATVASAVGVADLVARVRDVTDVATPLASMMGLALGVDYSLLMVSRFREARAEGAGVPEAAAIASRTSGRTVVVAGATILATMGVAVALAPGTFLQSAAIGAASAALVAVIAARTAVPAALVLLGPHLDRWRIGPPPRTGATPWSALAGHVLRRPLLTGLAALAVLVALAVPGVGLDAGPPDVRVLPEDAVARVDTERVVGALGPGWSAPLDAYAVDRSGRLAGSGGQAALAALRARLVADPDAATVLGPRMVGRTAVVSIIPRSGPNEPATAALYDRTRSTMAAFARQTGAEVAVGGVAAQLTDYRRAFRERLPWLVVALSAVAFVALVLVLRAVVLPLIGVVLNALVVAGSFGVLALLSTGSDPLLGGAGFADALSLLALLALVFGLSLDYQVFILTRLREGWLETGRIDDAVRRAVSRTGPVVMGAAAIMAGVFAAFVTAELQTIRQTGTGLVATVLLAALAVCLVAIPAAMCIAGRWTFWLPAWLDRALPRIDLEGSAPAPVSADAAGALELPLRTTELSAERARATLVVDEAFGAGGGAAAHRAVLPCAVEELFSTLVAARGEATVTLKSAIHHHAPVRVRHTLVLQAWCVEADGPRFVVRATVHDEALLLAEAEATLLALAPAAVRPREALPVDDGEMELPVT